MVAIHTGFIYSFFAEFLFENRSFEFIEAEKYVMHCLLLIGNI